MSHCEEGPGSCHLEPGTPGLHRDLPWPQPVESSHAGAAWLLQVRSFVEPVALERHRSGV